MNELGGMDSKIEANFSSLNKGLFTAAAFLIVLLGIRLIAQDLIAPLLLAIFLSAILYPLFRWFRNKGIPSALSLVLMILTFILSIGGLVLLLTWSFHILGDYIGSAVSSLENYFSSIAGDLGVSKETATDAAKQVSPEAVLNLISSLLGGLSNLMFYVFIIPILSIMMLLQLDSIPKDNLKELIKENNILSRVQKFASSVITYLSGRVKVNLLTGLGVTILLLFLGVDFPFLWGGLTVILSFIPYIGLFIAGAPPVIIAFSTNGLFNALLVVGGIVVINLIAENLLEPFIQGKGNKLSTATILVAIIFWTWLLGPIGALLSAPLTVLTKTILADYQETKWLADLMVGDYSHSKESIEKAGWLKNISRFNPWKSKPL